MKKVFLPFTTTLMGSMPRSKELLELKEKVKNDKSLISQYREKVYEETKSLIDMYERVGLDVIVTGELARDNYMSYVAEHVNGVQLMSMEEIKALTECSDRFDESLKEMDASDNSMNSPVCVGRIDTEAEMDSGELKILRKNSSKPFKATLPSPYLLTRSMWQKGLTKQFYKNRKELGEDVVKLLVNEIKRIVSMGAAVIQIDEPILSEVVFVKGKGDASFY